MELNEWTAGVYGSLRVHGDRLWETFTSPGGLRVFPESSVVPTEPIVPTPGSISALQTPSGAYAREYATCYVGGSSVGPCAAVVNPNAAICRNKSQTVSAVMYVWFVTRINSWLTAFNAPSTL